MLHGPSCLVKTQVRTHDPQAAVPRPANSLMPCLFCFVGYGRKEAAELLLDAGADMKTKNDAGQLPIDAARVNREMHMVKFLKSRGGDKSTEGSKYL